METNKNGIYDNAGLCDTLIADLNDLPKALFDGQYINFCNTVAVMAKKLLNLKKGITADMASKTETIERLKDQLRNCGQTVQDLPPSEFIQRMQDGGLDNGAD